MWRIRFKQESLYSPGRQFLLQPANNILLRQFFLRAALCYISDSLSLRCWENATAAAEYAVVHILLPFCVSRGGCENVTRHRIARRVIRL